MTLSISEIAGIINVAIVVSQFTFPLLLVLVLVGVVPTQSNAITWSVAGRYLNGSFWPTILRTDAAATSKVSKRVTFVSAFTTVALILLAAAAVTTPLGLYEAIITTSPDAVRFVYTKDASPIGQATLDRDAYNTTRMCGAFAWISCPGQFHGFYATTNSTGTYLNWDSDDSYISSVVPENLTDIFSSGRNGELSTIAGPLDIQFRSYKKVNSIPVRKSSLLNSSDAFPDPKIDNFNPRIVGTSQYAEMLLLMDDIVIRDGIVADMRNGGLGFRNHTMPAEQTSGTEWTEALLWLEPETVCVPSNISLELRLPEDDDPSNTMWLIDDGGIVNSITDYPYIDLNNTQRRPELYARAHKGAVLVNYNVRQELGVSKSNESHIGKTFLVEDSSSVSPGMSAISDFDLGLPGVSSLSVDPTANLSLIDSMGLVTSGSGGIDVADFSRIANAGGLVLGALTNKGNGQMNGRFDHGTNWSAPVYGCSTSLRASIMNVTFFMNGTSSLDNLRVRSLTPRTYASNVTTPLWAVENTGMNVSDVSPLWGLVDNSYEFDPRLWTIRREFMYLPTGAEMIVNFGMLGGSDAFASGAPVQTLGLLYDLSTSISDQLPDYMGSVNLPLKLKWQGLSQSTDGIAKMLALIWTDMTANYLTSARSQLNGNFTSALTYTSREAQKIPSSSQVTARTSFSAVRYKLPYATLAIIFLTLYLVVLLLALGMCITRRSTLHLLNSLLNQTNVGRAVVAERYRGDDHGVKLKTMSTEEFIRRHGEENIGILKDRKPDESLKMRRNMSTQAYEPVPEQIVMTPEVKR